VYGTASALSKIFNPDIAVIGNVEGAAGRNDVNPQAPIQLEEAEASFQAIVDPYARADFFFAFGPEGVEIEEGFLTFPALPGGLLAKVGRLRASFGKVNALHTHQLPWVDRPLVTENLVGGEEGIGDSGISVSRLITNPWVFLEATGEVYRGESTLFRRHDRGDLTYVGRLRGYQDLTEGTNLDVGASIAYGAIYRRFSARTELVWSRVGHELGESRAFGAFVSGEYQFARRWFGGARYDRSARALAPDLRDTAGSVLVTFWPSEFSQIRGQFRRVAFGDGPRANEVLFQFMFSIGAHGAHAF
jgi:hypothetical protein